ncbi:unnamed protein product [Amoebophrya sp. A120]|nr:unnamed protein product [Amoebophrya sp. A120]|eukprot:GSA120T00014223001.1
MVGVLFDKFDAIAVCVTQIPTLTLVAHGKKTGCLVDIGETTTSACCIYEGYLMPHTVDRNNYGGKDITELLLKFLKEERNIEFFGEEWRQLQNAEEILHKMGFVLTNGMTELKLCQPKNYECKLTGRVYSIKTERCRCLEALFKPQMFEQLRGINLGGKTLLTKEEQAYLQTLNSFQPSGSEEEVGGALKTTASLQELTCHAINCSNHPIRPELFMNIVLAGGVSRVTNLAQRLRQELRDMPFLKAMMNSCLGDEDDYLALQHRKRKTTKNDALTSSMESMDELTKMLELEEEEQRQFRRTGRIKLSNPLEYLKFDIIVHDPLDLRDLIPAKRADHMNHGDEISKSAADAVRGTGAAAKKPTFRIPGLMTEKERKEKEVKNRNSDGRGATTTAIPQFEPMIKPNEVYLGAANLASMDMFELLHFKREEYESGLTGVGGITGVHKKVV